ncbi:MAG: sulfatase-like hydrolase/transferase [Verrucomicrobia bacterium]|nr:sulfatase-like hydrolase/transferase [Verrucomicrobiota bacterium]
MLDSGTAEAVFEAVSAKSCRSLGGLPAAAWSRILVLFFALTLIKIVLLLGLGRHLCEIHWRVGGTPVTWWNPMAFYVFVFIGIISLAQLARDCRAVGVKGVRAANFTVLVLGLLFIFLTFHTGDKNYLYPILSGIVGWTSLGPYLSLDLFFRHPFLAFWMFGYAIAYYVLTRTGRETWTLHLTAICAGVYALLYLRELLVYRNELLVADCLGLVALLISRHPGGKWRIAWFLAPAFWSVGFVWALFYVAPPHDSVSRLYFLTLLGASVMLFSGATLIAHRRGFFGSWSNRVFFYCAAFLLLSNNHYPLAANYNHLLCLGLEFPRYFLGEFVAAGVLAIVAAFYCRLWPKAKLWWVDILNLLLIAMAWVDLRLAQIMGVRLDWDVLSLGNSPKMMWRMARPYLPGAVVGLGLALLVYAIAVKGLQLWFRRRYQPVGAAGSYWPGACYALACFVLLGVLGLLSADPDKAEGLAVARLVQTNPLWKRVANHTVSREEFLRSARGLGLGNFESAGKTYTPQEKRDLNVLLIFLESSHNRHLSLFGGSEETQPLVSRYKDRMELFPNFFSNFAGSIHARFATFTSLYPIVDFTAFTRERVGVKSLFEVLHDNGYTCSLFYSSFLDYTGFRDFLQGRGIDELYDADTMPGQRNTKRVSWGLREEETLGAILSQIKKYAARDQRFFLTYVPAAPHYPYDGVPERFLRFKPEHFKEYTPFYLNELLYMDWVVASILDQLKATGLLDRTLVIITNDHGERTGENGGPIGHGWNLTPELANTPLIILAPQKTGGRINYTIGSQIDVLPTILDLLRISPPAGQLYEGRSLYAPPEADGRVVYLNSYEQYGIVAGNHFVSGARKAEEGGASLGPRIVYSISNQGSKTFFAEPWRIKPFDNFQENFLRNYSFYCESIGKASRTNSVRALR